MARFRNEARGARAVLLKDRSYVVVDPGETKDIPDDRVDTWPADLVLLGGAEPKPRTIDDKRALLEAMGDDELREFVERATGAKPHYFTGRAKLIEMALAGNAPARDPLDHDGDGRKGGSLKGAASTAAKGAARSRGGHSRKPANG